MRLILSPGSWVSRLPFCGGLRLQALSGSKTIKREKPRERMYRINSNLWSEEGQREFWDLSPVSYFLSTPRIPTKPLDRAGKECLIQRTWQEKCFPCTQRVKFSQLLEERAEVCWEMLSLTRAATEFYGLELLFCLSLVYVYRDLQAHPFHTSIISKGHPVNRQEKHSSFFSEKASTLLPWQTPDLRQRFTQFL